MTPTASIFKRLAAMALVMLPSLAMAQSEIFEQMAKLPEAEYTYLSSAMISSAEDVLSISSQDILSQLKSIEILKSDNDQSCGKIRTDIKSKSGSMTLLSRIQDDGDVTEIYGTKASDNSQSRYHEILYIQDDTECNEITLIYLTGNIEPDAIREIVN